MNAKRIGGYLWALPMTLLGFLFAALALRRGRLAWSGGVLEASGGGVTTLLRRLPLGGNVLAMTFGHVILAADEATLEDSREHERVHVRQYARWGPLFLPAYALASTIAWAGGRHPYWDNLFERQARARPVAAYATPSEPFGPSGAGAPR